MGDAAFCPSLPAGEGASLAMAAAYLLAAELTRAGGVHRVAFTNEYSGRSSNESGVQRSVLPLGSRRALVRAFVCEI
jgi:2-polyprenyl-6-methoxyphenol hydroxylase-like FAD-dependent oxidoreductase